jgi:hypothetical protein
LVWIFFGLAIYIDGEDRIKNCFGRNIDEKENSPKSDLNSQPTNPIQVQIQIKSKEKDI